MIYHSPESFYLSTYFLSFTYIPFYLAPYIYILHLSFFIFSSTSFQALSWVIFYLSLESFFIFLLSSFLSFFLIFFIFHLIFFHLSPETRKSKSPSAAAVHCCRHSTKIKMLMITISFHSHSVQDDCGKGQLTPHLVRFPASLTFVSEQVGWGGPWLGVTWSSRDLGRCPAVLRADVRIECNFDFGGL